MAGYPQNSPLWISAAAAALVAAAAIFLFSDYRTAAERHRNVLLERGNALAESLTAGMRAQGRMARARGDRINVLFEEATRIPGVLGVRLGREDGSTVAAFGTLCDAPPPPAGAPVWSTSSVMMTVPIDLPPVDDPHAGEMHVGPRQAVPAVESLPAGSYAITLALDAAPVYRQVLRERIRFAVALVVVVCAVAAAAGLLVLLLHRLALESDLARAREVAAENQRLAQLGAGLAHETKNPLNVVRGLAQGIANTTEAPNEIRAQSLRIVDEVDRTVGHLNAFLTLSRPKEARLAPVPVAAFLDDVVSLIQPEARGKGASIEVASERVSILADHDMLRRAMLNLLVNALRACDANGRVRVEAHADGECIGLSVTDNGCGIAPRDLPRVKEPYFSRFEGGTGLGLAIVEQIARAHGATLDVLPVAGGGVCVRLNGFRRAR